MRQNALLRLLLACFLLYIAWPSLQVQGGQISSLFWLGWSVFFLLVAGSNLAVVLKLPTKLEFKKEEEQKGKEISFGKN